MYKALYREYRPEVFDELLGQEHIVKILKNQISKNEVSHAYLFCGTRGTGKTTVARILAKGINCTAADGVQKPCGECSNCRSIKEGSFMDVIEIDAASNNGVENIRELRESVKYPPAVGYKKVYIIDEVHMLSQGAFNALLKTLEEPPAHVIFILATTDPQKLPQTILSRCMRLDFKRVSESVLFQGMKVICQKKGVEITDSALKIVVSGADGSVRDGLSILEQCLATGEKQITEEIVLDFLGIASETALMEMTMRIKEGDVSKTLLQLNRLMNEGKDVRQLIRDWISHYRNLLILKFMEASEDNLNVSAENIERLKEQAEMLELQDINNAIMELSKVSVDAKWSSQPRILLELCIVRLATGLMTKPLETSIPVNTKADIIVRKELAAKTETAAMTEQVSKTETIKAQTEKAISKNSEASQSVSSDVIQEIKGGTAEYTPSDAAKDFDLKEIWRKVFEEGEASKSSFNLLRMGTTLVAINEGEFLVKAEGVLKEKYLADNRETIEDLMEKFTGKRRQMRCVKDGELADKKNDTQDMRQIMSSLSGLFGGDIEIK